MKITHKKTKPIDALFTGCKVLRFTNQNIGGWITKVGKSKNVLSNAASGDLLANSAFVLGAENITAFDVNKETLFYSELKLVAHVMLNRDEFLNFFTNNGIMQRNRDLPFSREVYLFLRNELTDETREFWDEKYEKCGCGLMRNEIACKMFEGRIPLNLGVDSPVPNNPYLQPENYKKSQDATSGLNVELLHTDMENLPREIEGKKYGLGIFSNIEGFVGSESFHRHGYCLERFKKFFDASLSPLLSQIKTIQATHVWCHDEAEEAKAQECAEYVESKGHKASIIKFKPAWSRRLRVTDGKTNDSVLIVKR
jgi:hypothetical protein